MRKKHNKCNFKWVDSSEEILRKKMNFEKNEMQL